MNPSKPLMALGAALLVAAPSAVRADDSADWKPVHTKTQSYYVGKDSFGEYEKMQKPSKTLQKAGPIQLFVEEKPAGQPLQKVPSGAELGCARITQTKVVKKVKQTMKIWHCAITVNARTGGAYNVPVTVSDEQPQITTTVLQAAAERPADVSQEVWAEIVSGTHKPAIPEDKWVQAARDVEKVLQSPKGQKLRAGDTAGLSKLINAVSLDISKGADDATIVQKAIDLSDGIPVTRTPKNLPAPPSVAGSNDGTGAGDQSGRAVKTVDGANVLNTLAQLLAQDQVQEDFYVRLGKFIEEPKGEDSYLDVEGHPDALKALPAGLAEAVKKLCADEAGRGKAAVLYFMIGDTAKPWFKDHDELKTLASDQAMRAYFREAMKPWTKKGAGVPSVANAGRYNGDQKWPPAFLEDALAKADKVWKDPRVKGQIKLNIDRNDQGLPVMGDVRRGGGLGGDLNNLAAIRFDSQQTWESGAVIKMMQIPGSNPPAYRKIAMKITAQQTAWGPPPVVEDRLMVVDITNASPDGGRTPDHFFGRYFTLDNQSENKSFAMDQNDPKSIKYSMKMSGGQLTLTALDAKGKPSGEPMSPSVTDVYKAREDQLNSKKDSYVTEVNGQRFRVIPQPGFYTGLAYFPADASGHITANAPALMVDLSKYGKPILKDGVPSDRPLGYIGKDDSGNPQFWYMHYNPDTRMYEYKKDAAPKDAPFDPMAKKVDPAATAGNTTTGTATATPTPTDTTAAGGNTAAGNTGGSGPGSNNPNDPSVTNAKLQDCSSEWAKSFGASQNKDELYRKDGGWMLYSNGKADPTQVNNTWLCVYKQMGIYFDGLVPKGSISVDGDEKSGTLRVPIVRQGAADADSPEHGSVLISPSDADNLTVKDGQIVYGQNRQRMFANQNGASDFVFKLTSLKANLQKANAAFKLGDARKLAWIELVRDYSQGNQNPAFTVFLRPDEDAKALLLEAVKLYGGENTLCKSGGDVSDAIKGQIDAAVADDAFKTALSKVDMKQISTPLPNVEFKCLAQGTNTEGTWNLMNPSWGDSKKIFLARNGKVDPNSGYKVK